MTKDAQPDAFRGKWTLVYFWGFHCAPCLRDELPALVRFHDEHPTLRDRFQIIAVCVDHDDALASMADVDRRLAPIVEHVWGGKALPFPLALDTADATWMRHGMETLGPALIDPEGRYIEGDRSTLAAKLGVADDQAEGP